MNVNDLVPYNFLYGKKLITHYAEIIETKWENKILVMVKIKSYDSKIQFINQEYHDKMIWEGDKIPEEIKKHVEENKKL